MRKCVCVTTKSCSFNKVSLENATRKQPATGKVLGCDDTYNSWHHLDINYVH